MVAVRGGLPDLPAVVRRRRRRRGGRPARRDQPARARRRARRRRGVADPVPALAAGRPRLRRQRLPATWTRCSARSPTSTPWSRTGPRAGAAGHRRPGPQPLLVRAPGVPGCAGGWPRQPGAGPVPLPPRPRPRRDELPPNNWPSVFGGPAWTRVTEADGQPGEWYLHLYAPEQPDWNWRHPATGRAPRRTPCASGSTAAPTACASTWRTGCTRPTACPTCADTRAIEPMRLRGNPLACDQEEVHEVYRRWRAHRRGVLARAGPRRRGQPAAGAGRRATCAPTSCTRPSPSRSSRRRGTPGPGGPPPQGLLDGAGRTGSPVTWVVENHDVVRAPTRYGGGGAGRPAPGRRCWRCSRFPGSAYLYQGQELGLPEVDVPDRGTDRTRPGCAPGSPATAPGCRCRGPRSRPAPTASPRGRTAALASVPVSPGSTGSRLGGLGRPRCRVSQAQKDDPGSDAGAGRRRPATAPPAPRVGGSAGRDEATVRTGLGEGPAGRRPGQQPGSSSTWAGATTPLPTARSCWQVVPLARDASCRPTPRRGWRLTPPTAAVVGWRLSGR